MNNVVARIASAFGLLLVASSVVVAADEGYRLRVERIDTSSYPTVRLVVSVADAAGRPVRGLTRDDVVVREGGVRAPATVDLASETTVVGLAFVLDASNSMSGAPLREAVNATVGLIQRLGPRDQATLIVYREAATVIHPLSADKASLVAAARSIATSRSAELASWEGFKDGLTKANAALLGGPFGSRGTIILVTDGFDETSPREQVEAGLAHARASVYPIDPVAVGAQRDRVMFEAIATASRGQAFFAPTPAALADAYSALSEQILTQYTVSYVSAKPGRPGEGRSLGIELIRGGVVLAKTEFGYAIPVGAPPPPGTAEAPVVLSAGQSLTVAGGQAPELATREVSTSLSAGAALLALAPQVVNDPAIVVAVLGAASALSLILFFWNGVIASTSRIRRRLDGYIPAGKGMADAAQAQRPPLRDRYVRPLLASLGGRLQRVTPASMLSSSALALEQAGSPLGMGPTEFVGLRAGAALALAAGGFLLARAIAGGAETTAVLTAVGLVLGFLIPGVLVSRSGRARKKQILRALPSTLDMISLSVEAGLAFDGAVAQVVQRRQNPLTDEFKRMLVEFQMGRPRKDALREVARRTGVPEVGRFMNGVIQADALGTPLAKILGDLAVEMRTRRRQRAEELARTAPIKMMFPMVGLIFPALFVVILGPAAARLATLFAQVR